jgi:pilus assembly protein CpaE
MVSLPQETAQLAIAVRGAGLSEQLITDTMAEVGFREVQFVGSLGELKLAISRKSPRLVFVPVPHMARGDGESVNALVELSETLRRYPGTLAIATAPEADARTVLAALRAGMLEFVETPSDATALLEAVRRVLTIGAPITPSGKIITIYSAKGGLGGTTLSLSLAWALRHREGTPASVAFVDFTTTGAGARVMLDLEPVYDLGSVVSRQGAIDRAFMRSCMLQHPSGVHVLVAAEELDATDPLDLETAGRVLELLREEYEYVVVDVDHHFADQTLAARDIADRVVLVSQLDVSALRSAQRTLGVFTRLGYAGEKVALVVNRRTDRDRISITDAERVLGRQVDLTLPNDYAACADAITFGRFVQQHAPESPFVPAVHAMAATLTGGAAAVLPEDGDRRGTSRLARLFARH